MRGGVRQILIPYPLTTSHGEIILIYPPSPLPLKKEGGNFYRMNRSDWYFVQKGQYREQSINDAASFTPHTRDKGALFTGQAADDTVVVLCGISRRCNWVAGWE